MMAFEKKLAKEAKKWRAKGSKLLIILPIMSAFFLCGIPNYESPSETLRLEQDTRKLCRKGAYTLYTIMWNFSCGPSNPPNYESPDFNCLLPDSTKARLDADYEEDLQNCD